MKNNIIKNLRLSKGYSKKELAEKLGISVSMMEKIESNDRRANDETKKKICKLFNVSMDYLMDMQANDLIWKNKIKQIIELKEKSNGEFATLPNGITFCISDSYELLEYLKSLLEE
jgi:transcriptional regulator with XRE-family HTH domain